MNVDNIGNQGTATFDRTLDCGDDCWVAWANGTFAISVPDDWNTAAIGEKIGQRHIDEFRLERDDMYSGGIVCTVEFELTGPTLELYELWLENRHGSEMILHGKDHTWKLSRLYDGSETISAFAFDVGYVEIVAKFNGVEKL